jgi:ribosomal protein S6
MPDEIKQFETIVIFTAKKYEDSMNRVQDICQEFTGKEFHILKEDFGVKKLAYEIAGNKTGYYVRYVWNGTRENVRELEKCLQSEDSALKFITVCTEDTDDFVELEPYSEQKDDQISSQSKKPIVDALDIIYGLKES